jgi:hypothetical protein
LEARRATIAALLSALEQITVADDLMSRTRELALLQRAARVVDQGGGPPGARYVDGATQTRIRFDPLRLRELPALTTGLKENLQRQLAILDLGLEALSFKGRPPGGLLHPLVRDLASYWIHATEKPPTVSRRTVQPADLPEWQFRQTNSGYFLEFCTLALRCLPPELRHGEGDLEAVVRAVAENDAELSKKLSLKGQRSLDNNRRKSKSKKPSDAH